MQTLTLVIILVVALPLILVCLGFFLLIVTLFKGRSQEAQSASAVALAQELHQTLARMETRMNALEDILLTHKTSGGGPHHDGV